eukprot:171168-Chlamydomonas_euryale.AAC.1
MYKSPDADAAIGWSSAASGKAAGANSLVGAADPLAATRRSFKDGGSFGDGGCAAGGGGGGGRGGSKRRPGGAAAGDDDDDDDGLPPGCFVRDVLLAGGDHGDGGVPGPLGGRDHGGDSGGDGGAAELAAGASDVMPRGAVIWAVERCSEDRAALVALTAGGGSAGGGPDGPGGGPSGGPASGAMRADAELGLNE